MSRLVFLFNVAFFWLEGLAPAHAIPVGAAIAAALGATGTLAAVIGGVVNIGLAVGLSYLTGVLTRSSAAKTARQQPQGVSGHLQTGGTVSRSFIFGRWPTAGSLAQVWTWGASGQTPNAYLTQVIALSDLPVTGLVEIWVAGRKVTYNPAGAQTGKGQAIAQYNVNGADHLWIRFHDGNQTAVDSFLFSQFGSAANYPWPSTNVGWGVAYVVVTALVDPNLFQGLDLQLKFLIDGVAVLDPRNNSRAWSHNPVLAIYNLLCGFQLGGNWVYGGQTITGAQLPEAVWAAAANACDTVVTNADSSTSSQFVAGGEITLDTQPLDEVKEFLKACNGRLAETGGRFKIHIGAAGVAVLSFSDLDVLADDHKVFTPFEPLGTVVNTVVATYVEKAQSYQSYPLNPVTNSAFVADDGRIAITSVDYKHVIDGRQAQRLATAELQESRRQRRHVLPMPPSCFQIEPLDFVSWTSAHNGYSAKLFRVDRKDDLTALGQVFYLTEVDPSDYDWDAFVQEQAIPQAVAIFVPAAAADMVGWTAVGVLVPTGDGVAEAAIQLGWSPAQDDVAYVQFEVRLASDSTYVVTGNTDRLDVASLIISQNIHGLTNYEVRGRYLPKLHAYPGAWSAWLAVSTPDARIDFVALSNQMAAEIALITNQAHGSLQRIRDDLRELIERTAADAAINTGVSHTSRDEIRTSVIATGENAAANLFAAVQTINTAVVAGDTANASAITLVQATAAANTAAISTESTARATGDAANAASITTVAAAAAAANAGVVSESTARAAGDAANASTISAVSAVANAAGATGAANTAAISTESTARASGDAANAASISAVSAAADAANAGVVSESAARASGDAANAASINAVSAVANSADGTANQISASGFIKIEAIASPGGGIARFSVFLNAGSVGTPNWKGAGLYLDIVGGVARFFADVDQFFIGNAATGSAPFFISGGVTFIRKGNIQALDAAQINADQINVNHLTVNSVTTPKIVTDAVNSLGSAFGTAGNTHSATGTYNPPTDTFNEVNVTVTSTGGKIIIEASCDIQMGRPFEITFFQLRRGTTILLEKQIDFACTVHEQDFFTDVAINTFQNVSLAYQETPAAGSYTYSLVSRIGNSANASRGYFAIISNRFICVQEVKR